VLVLLPLFFLVDLPTTPPLSGYLTNADVDSLVAASEVAAGGTEETSSRAEQARLEEEAALRDYASAVQEGYSPSARLLDTLSTLKVRRQNTRVVVGVLGQSWGSLA
jgi:hypothetical protein